MIFWSSWALPVFWGPFANLFGAVPETSFSGPFLVPSIQGLEFREYRGHTIVSTAGSGFTPVRGARGGGGGGAGMSMGT